MRQKTAIIEEWSRQYRLYLKTNIFNKENNYKGIFPEKQVVE